MLLRIICCISKTFALILAPVYRLYMGILISVLFEFIKFSIILLLMFGIGKLIFYPANGNQKSVEGGLKKDRLSDSLLQNGSLSKYPYVVDIPSESGASNGHSKSNSNEN